MVSWIYTKYPNVWIFVLTTKIAMDIGWSLYYSASLLTIHDLSHPKNIGFLVITNAKSKAMNTGF